MPIQQRRQLLNPCLSLSVWPLASYLTYLSLNFLIVEMSMRMQRLCELSHPDQRLLERISMSTV